MTKNTIAIRSHIKLEDIAGLLGSASRGASYWCENKLDFESEVDAALEKTGVGFCKLYDTEEEKPYLLNLKKIKRGMTVMAKKEPKHFADFVSGDYDQTTGDVFLQCCLFGEVIYG